MKLYKQFEGHLAQSEASNRSFGWLCGVVFLIIGLYPAWRGGGIRWWAVGIGIAAALLALIAPGILQKPKRAWLFLGFLLAQVVNPIVLSVLFFCIITPIGLIGRLLKRDPLRLKFEPERTSYWIERTEAVSDMTDQF
jgi:hypothetical protein